MDISVTGTGKRGRALEDVVEISDETLGNQATRRRVGDPHSVSVAQKKVAKGRAQWRNLI